MLSVLIPVHNYNVCKLVSTLHNQLVRQGLSFEIICHEDRSNEDMLLVNEPIKQLDNVHVIISPEQNGSLKSRIIMANKARFDWLLFLDADTLPVSDTFITQYINATAMNSDAILGGIAYQKEKPDERYILRWKYGIKYEQVSAKNRNRHPFKNVVSGNLMIKREVYSSLDLHLSENKYGVDNLLGSRLMSAGKKIMHIDNPVYHLGLEPNPVYLQKKEEAARALLEFYRNGMLESHEVSLLRLFLNLKKLRLNHFFSFCYKIFGSAIRKNLCGSHPSTILLQLYRLCYLCHIESKSKNQI